MKNEGENSTSGKQKTASTKPTAPTPQEPLGGSSVTLGTLVSPMMRQYLEFKEKHKSHILFFRLGDFYEMFFDDAKTVSRELELTLTGRDCGLDERAPMCGVPYHSADTYIARLIAKGYKVAVCEQMESPSEAKGIVRREVVRLISKGTIIDADMLDEGRNNYLCSIFLEGSSAGVCFSDVSTGAVYLNELHGEDIVEQLVNELTRFSPSEVIANGAVLSCTYLLDYIRDRLTASFELWDTPESSAKLWDAVMSRFGQTIETTLCGSTPMLRALAGLIFYLRETGETALDRLSYPEVYSNTQFMGLDAATRRNLELTATMRTGERRGSLIWVLDRTKTAMGRRLLREYIAKPLVSPLNINRRLDAVRELHKKTRQRDDFIELLNGMPDIERIMTRVVHGTAGGRELLALRNVLSKLPYIKAQLINCKSELLLETGGFDELPDIAHLIETAISDDPPVSIREGGLIKAGFDKRVDEYRDTLSHAKDYLARIELGERERTGIKNLKISYNRVFGYYFEITRSNAHLVPEDYQRKQTLANSERYINDELKALEEKILTADEQSAQLEYELFCNVRTEVAAALGRFSEAAKAVAQLDVLVSFAEVAVANNYTRPVITTDGCIAITDGRHPVVELLSSSPFVANDVTLDIGDNQIALITGPNMAGKSTYMRQTALITLMAQIGSFVPAAHASVSVVDAMFTRVGAADDLAAGQSTFMVEMSEMAHILKHATPDSLILLDEIGRGTSTFDGMSLARSVLEYLCSEPGVRAKTMFATHYHELTVLEDIFPPVKNYNIVVKKKGEDILFLRRIVRGPTDDSYGIEVARLAGVPDKVVVRAREILSELEQGGHTPVKRVTVEQHDPVAASIINRLKYVDVRSTTPLEALNILSELKCGIEE